MKQAQAMYGFHQYIPDGYFGANHKWECRGTIRQWWFLHLRLNSFLVPEPVLCAKGLAIR